MKGQLRKGFSLAELGIALVILLIVSTIAVISYFSIIDNAKEVKVIEEAKTIRLSLAREGITPEEVSKGIEYDILEPQVKNILEYHLSQGTNLTGMIFKNEVLIKDGNYIIGELRTPIKEVNVSEGTVLINIFKPMIVKAETGINIDNIVIEVRKLDNNEMNKLFQEQLEGDWFIVNDVYEKKEENISMPISENKDSIIGLLDNKDLIKSTDLPIGAYDNDFSTSHTFVPKVETRILELNYPVDIDGYYVRTNNGSIGYEVINISFYDDNNSRLKKVVVKNPDSGSYVNVDINGVKKIDFVFDYSFYRHRLVEFDIFGSYIKK